MARLQPGMAGEPVGDLLDIGGGVAVAGGRQRGAHRLEVTPAVRAEEARDVLDDDGARRPILLRQRLHQPPEAEKGRRAPASQPRPRAGQAEVLAGTSSLGDFGVVAF